MTGVQTCALPILSNNRGGSTYVFTSSHSFSDMFTLMFIFISCFFLLFIFTITIIIFVFVIHS